MRGKIVLAVLVLFVAALVAGSVAYAKPAGIPEKIKSQQDRIRGGIRNGQLTKHEADMLMDNLNHIQGRFEKLRVEGRLTPQNRQELQMMLDRNSRMIYQKKHNPVQRLY